MCKMPHFHPRSAAVCLSAALLLATFSTHAQEREAPAGTLSSAVALVSPEPVLQLSPRGQVGGDESMIREPTFRKETRRTVYPNRPLLVTGTTIFGLSYLPSVIGAAVADSDGNDDTNDLYIPVAGPWMMLAKSPEEGRGEKTLLAVSGVAQGIGALMLLSSFFVPERVTERWYLIGSKGPVRMAPSRVATGYGLSTMGRF
jgi:hypothetical protein